MAVTTIDLVIMTAVALVTGASGHGRLFEPPSRSSAWRYGFSTPANYNDHELYCGGYNRQWQTNGGKCGICGDPWDTPQPRENEGGGKYGTGVIVKTYRVNSIIRIGVELTANHRGFFEFRLCPNNNPKKPATQRCLDRHKLLLADGSDHRFYPPQKNGKLRMRYRLPKALTCQQCVLQWRYVAGNNWGMCKNGTGRVGCGPQEEFRACSDIRILDSDGIADDEEFDDDYNDISNEGITELEEDLEETSFTGTILAIVAAFIVAILFFLVIFGYFLCAKDKIQQLKDAKKPSVKFASKFPPRIFAVTKPSLKTNGILKSSLNVLPPAGPQESLDAEAVPPACPVPPPRQKKALSPEKTAVMDISSPTSVTINGIAVVSELPDPAGK